MPRPSPEQFDAVPADGLAKISAVILALGLPLGLAAQTPSAPAVGDSASVTITQKTVSPGPAIMEQIAGEIEALHKKAKHALVRVRSETPLGKFNGTGFLIDSQGHILTVSSLVPESGEVTIEHGGPEIRAEVIGIDRPSSIALLKAQLNEPKHLAFRQGVPVPVGTALVILGFPYHGDSSPVFAITGGLDRTLPDGRMLCVSHLRINAPITPGMIGSPLLDTRGKVCGVVTGSAAQGRLTYALPTPAVRRVLADLEEHGRVRRGWIGMELEERRSIEGGRTFMLITKIHPGTPAAKQGLKKDDIVLSLDGNEIKSRFDLIEAAFHTGVGTQIPVMVTRDGEQLAFHLTIVERPTEMPFVEVRKTRGISSSK